MLAAARIERSTCAIWRYTGPVGRYFFSVICLNRRTCSVIAFSTRMPSTSTEDPLEVSRAVQDADDLDPAGDGAIEDDVISVRETAKGRPVPPAAGPDAETPTEAATFRRAGRSVAAQPADCLGDVVGDLDQVFVAGA